MKKKALIKIRSSYVVQLLDVVSFEALGEEITCLVLEYIDGNNLKEGELQLNAEYYSTLWQIAKGLNEIHSAGIIHRDLKLDNIRRDDEGTVKIIDFGLSREVGVDNRTMSSIGYLPFMAPELRGKPPIEFSTAADVYAYGVSALALSPKGLPDSLKGLAPSVKSNLAEQHLPGVDASFHRVFQACLSLRPEDRPTMSEVLTVIERIVLRDQHRARVVVGGYISEISSANRTISPNISWGGKVLSQIEIYYDGNEFTARSVRGLAKANNIPLQAGSILPRSCVLALRGTTSWHFATFDTSSPEFMP